MHLEEPSLVGDPLPVEQAADQHRGLVEAVQPLAEPRSEVDAESLMLAVEPAPAETEGPRDRPRCGSSVVASLAIRPGFRNVADDTSSPSLARDVTDATADSAAQPSSLGSSHAPSSDSRWSSSQMESQPARSTARQASRRSGQPVLWIQNAAPNRILGFSRPMESRNVNTGVAFLYASARIAGRSGE